MDGRADAGDRIGAIATAERAVGTLVGSLGDKPDATPIETNAGSLRGVATVIANLLTEVRACAGADCMGRTVDGVRLWVTQDRLNQEIERATAAAERADRYAAALRAIESASMGQASDFAMLVDWHSIAVGMQHHASAALADAPQR